MRTKICAEIGINHNGSLEIAKQLIDVAKDTGCDYVKFQKRTPDKTVPESEKNKMRDTPWGTITYLQYKHKLEFDEKEYDEIDRYCKEKNISWFASPWDIDSYRFLKKYDLPYIKIASAMITDYDLLNEIAKNNDSVIISTGMSTKEELDNALMIIGKQTEYILACTSSYPTKNEEMNLRFLDTLKEQYPGYKIGFSNHHPGIFFMCCSVALGAEMIEFHVTLDRSMYGSDQPASIEPPGIRKIVNYVKGLEVAMGTGEWIVYDSEKEIKKKLRKV
jgi:N-acetylneuraminate synthase